MGCNLCIGSLNEDRVRAMELYKGCFKFIRVIVRKLVEELSGSLRSLRLDTRFQSAYSQID